MCLAQDQQITGLGDVLRRRAPMHPAAMRVADHARKLPHERNDGMTGAGKAFIDAGTIHLWKLRSGGDRLGCINRNDPKSGLCPSERDLYVQPGLPAVFQAIQRADAGILHARGGR